MIRDLKGLLGSRVFARDGEVGKVDDFYFDAEKWAIRSFVVQTGGCLGGRRVLVSAAALSRPRAWTGIISVNLTKDMLRNTADASLAWPRTGPALHSFRNIKGYRIDAREGIAGVIDGLIVDDVEWVIRYVTINTASEAIGAAAGRKVLLAPQWIKDLQNDPWNERSDAVVDLSKLKIAQAPEYLAGMDIDRAYEENLAVHYGQDRYWVTEESQQKVD